MASKEENIEKIKELLQILVKKELKDVFNTELSDKNTKLLYELTGKATIRELEKKTGFSLATISRKWQKWEQVGLLKKKGKFYTKVLD